MSKTYNVWITALTDSYADRVVAALVRSGFDVGPLSGRGELSIVGTHSTLIALRLTTTPNDKVKGEEWTPTKINDAVRKALGEFEALFYSLVVVGDGTSSWNGSNVPKAAKKEETRFDRVSSDAAE